MYCSDFNALRQKYATAVTTEDRDIKRSLDVIAKLFSICDESEYYYAEVITRHFCRIIHTIERKKPHSTEKIPPADPKCPAPYESADSLLRDFYNHYKKPEQVDYSSIPDALDQDRKDLVNLTIKDYISRICTFTTAKYLGKMVDPQILSETDPILYTYDNIEWILAAFQTRNDRGEILRQNVNIRSALRKLNEFKQSRCAKT